MLKAETVKFIISTRGPRILQCTFSETVFCRNITDNRTCKVYRINVTKSYPLICPTFAQ